MRKINVLFVFVMVGLFMGCKNNLDNSSLIKNQGPSIVEMHQIDGKYRLFVNGEEFYVKGAGCEFGPCYAVAAHGGNSIRTWRTDNSQKTGLEILDEAWEHGLMVMMGLDVARERHGFDYDDEEAVATQLERLRNEVIELKDHPALLGWGIGNELNLRYTNFKVWDAVNDIAKMIKEVDGNHVTTTMLAGIGPNEVAYIAENCPDLDFLSIQIYGRVDSLPQILKQANFDGPYLLTEWGATGHWEMPSTSWGSAIEQTSHEKAQAIERRYKNVILEDDANCMGSYVFLWGQKQERTPSWYGLFTEKGEKTETIGVMEYLWTGNRPDFVAPEFIDLEIEGKGGRFDDVKLKAGKSYTAKITANHNNMLSVTVRAEVMPEPTELSDGGDYEHRPPSVKDAIELTTPFKVKFHAPENAGAYRLLVYLIDEHNNAGTANIPFLVKK